MPLATTEDLPTAFPKPDYLTLSNFKRGVITIIDQSHTPTNALVQADNAYLVEDGQPAQRPGTDWYGVVMPNAAAIDGFDYFDFSGVIHLVAVAGGNVYRSTDNAATWTLCTGGNTTSGVWTNMNQNGALLYLTNGTDNTLRYDGSTVLQSYTALSTPAAPTAVVSAGLTGTNFTSYYKYASVNDVGFSIASPAVAVTVAQQRGSWDNTTNFVTLTLPAPQATQLRGDIYYSEDNVNFYYLDSIVSSTAVPNVTYKDGGTAVIVPGTLAPTGNTTQGTKYAELVNVGARQYGVRDPGNRYRIGFTGTGNFSGAFSTAYDGGYLDWQPGGKYFPVHVEDYRDGKGTPLATVWCDSADGQGCILQMSLDSVTVQDITITIPSAYKLPGSRGTPAPGSVVNVLNDYMFYNNQAFYNLGSRAQFLNLLSTDESSANVRPNVKQISSSSESKIATAYVDAKVLFSVPIGSTENNTTMVYDTERKAWLPTAFLIGFKKFLRYTATDSLGTKSHKLLALRPGDNRLSEIASNIQGDYGVAFTTTLKTGLYPTSKNRFEFQFTEEAEMEFSNPQGDITVEILGIDRQRGYRSIKTVPISTSGTTLSGTGWDVYAWDTIPWDDTAVVPQVYSAPSDKRYTPVQKELNAIQYVVTTDTLDARFVLRTLQSWGTPTEGGHPSAWRVR